MKAWRFYHYVTTEGCQACRWYREQRLGVKGALRAAIVDAENEADWEADRWSLPNPMEREHAPLWEVRFKSQWPEGGRPKTRYYRVVGIVLEKARTEQDGTFRQGEFLVILGCEKMSGRDTSQIPPGSFDNALKLANEYPHGGWKDEHSFGHMG